MLLAYAAGCSQSERVETWRNRLGKFVMNLVSTMEIDESLEAALNTHDVETVTVIETGNHVDVPSHLDSTPMNLTK